MGDISTKKSSGRTILPEPQLRAASSEQDSLLLKFIIYHHAWMSWFEHGFQDESVELGPLLRLFRFQITGFYK